MILFEVIDQVPEALLIRRFSSEEVKLVLDVIKKIAALGNKVSSLLRTQFSDEFVPSLLYSLSNRTFNSGYFIS